MRALLSLATAASLFAFVMQPAGAAAETGYAAVWRPGSGAQWWRSGMTADELKAQDKPTSTRGCASNRWRFATAGSRWCGSRERCAMVAVA
jgi:hypothetical protein